jgi:hypothetical protein
MENEKYAHLLKMVQRKKLSEKGEMNGVEDVSSVFVGTDEDHIMSFDFKDVLDFAVDGVQFGTQDKQQNGKLPGALKCKRLTLWPGTNAGFRTDTDVSGGQAPRERELQRWTPSAETDVDLSLEQSGSGSGEAWDQFKANERLFGLKTDYNEEIYTTTIDRSNPSYREREARAQRLAREIEGSATTDAHTLEERGIVNSDGGLDEEAKYVVPYVSIHSLANVQVDTAVFIAKQQTTLLSRPAAQVDTPHQHAVHRAVNRPCQVHQWIQQSSHLRLLGRTASLKQPILLWPSLLRPIQKRQPRVMRHHQKPSRRL